MKILITINLQKTLWHITATKKLQDYSSLLSAEMKGLLQIVFLYKNQFYKHEHKNKINKASSYLWYKLWSKVPN